MPTPAPRPNAPSPLAEQLRRELGADQDLSALARSVYGAVARRVPFDFACLATTDPATGLVTWASKTRDLGVGDEEFAAAEYGRQDVNSLAEIAERPSPVGVLSVDTDGRPDSCRRLREFMGPRFGFTDELRVVFRSRGVGWGVLALYRGDGDPPFTAEDGAEVVAVSELVAERIQRALFRLDVEAGTAAPDPAAGGHQAPGPAVLIVDRDDGVTHLTPAARAVVEALGGWDHGSLPAPLLVVVARTRTRGAHVESQVQAGDGRWLSVHAVPLTGPSDGGDVVVTVEPTPRATLSRLTLAAHGLTGREEEVALLVLQGADTKAIASTLFLSPHTVQDHLKAIFAKLGVSSRRELVARLVLS